MYLGNQIALSREMSGPEEGRVFLLWFLGELLLVLAAEWWHAEVAVMAREGGG